MAEWRIVLADRCAAAGLEGPAREAVQREIEEHLQDRFEDLVSGGASAAAADRAAVAEVPDVAAIRALAKSRPAHGPATVPAPPMSTPAGTPFATIGRDVRFALRLFLATVAIADESTAKQVVRLVEGLEENDDVQDVYANFDIPEAVLEAVAG